MGEVCVCVCVWGKWEGGSMHLHPNQYRARNEHQGNGGGVVFAEGVYRLLFSSRPWSTHPPLFSLRDVCVLKVQRWGVRMQPTTTTTTTTYQPTHHQWYYWCSAINQQAATSTVLHLRILQVAARASSLSITIISKACSATAATAGSGAYTVQQRIDSETQQRCRDAVAAVQPWLCKTARSA